MSEKKAELFEENETARAAVEVLPSALELQTKAEIDMQISTAKRYPRSLKQFRQDALAMATIDEETAASCFYALPRKDADGSTKNITGPSARLAEIIASSWGNIRAGARIVDDDGKFVTSQGVCHDLEKNVATTIEVKRRVSGKTGRRFSDDMVAVTCNAANSIALRNAVFKVVPKCYVNQVYNEARKVAIGNASTLKDKRDKAVDYFKKLGVSEKRILLAVEKPSLEDVGLEELEVLHGYATAIKEGDSSIDGIFPPEPRQSAFENNKASAPVSAPSPAPQADKTLSEMLSAAPVSLEEIQAYYKEKNMAFFEAEIIRNLPSVISNVLDWKDAKKAEGNLI